MAERVVGSLAAGVGPDRWRCGPQAGTANALTTSLAQGWSLGGRNRHRKVLPRALPSLPRQGQSRGAGRSPLGGT